MFYFKNNLKLIENGSLLIHFLNCSISCNVLLSPSLTASLLTNSANKLNQMNRIFRLRLHGTSDAEYRTTNFLPPDGINNFV